ncbi:hypothetical protein RUND412_002867 [Rhizina undulata]
MRPSFRLLTARLPPLSPTGVTGVLTHPFPRPTLIAVYKKTLALLSELPEHSVYRQSTENLTRARLAIVEAVKPRGYEEYQKQVEQIKAESGAANIDHHGLEAVAGHMRDYVHEATAAAEQEGKLEFFGILLKQWARTATATPVKDILPAPHQLPEEALNRIKAESNQQLPDYSTEFSATLDSSVKLPVEPDLSAEQVEEIESQIGGGLIEEIIEQGWNEMQLVGQMKEAKIWESLEVQPEEGQWEAFERKP